MVVVGGGAAGVYGEIRAKILSPDLKVLVIEKLRFFSKVSFFFSINYYSIGEKIEFFWSFIYNSHVKIWWWWSMNVTNGNCTDKIVSIIFYIRSYKLYS